MGYLNYPYGYKNNLKPRYGAIVFMLVVLFCLTGLILLAGNGCMVSEKETIRAAEKQGYQDVQIKERHNFFSGWHGCGSSDSAAFKAKAKNPRGDDVDIIICAGWPFKGVTVRTE